MYPRSGEMLVVPHRLLGGMERMTRMICKALGGSTFGIELSGFSCGTDGFNTDLGMCSRSDARG